MTNNPSWLDYNWPWVGLVIGSLLTYAALTNPGLLGIKKPTMSDPRFLATLGTALYMLHEVEEYGIDALGRYYAFPTALCTTIGQEPPPKCSLPYSFYTAVNMGSVWEVGFIGIIMAYKDIRLALAIYGLELVNAVVHAVAAVRGPELYNSGLASALLLFLPISVWVFRSLLRAKAISLRTVGVVMFLGWLGHAVLLVSLMGFLRGFYGETTLVLLQVLNGFVPYLILSVFGV